MTDIINLTAKRTNKNGDPKAENGITPVSKPTISYDGETITVPVIHTGFAPTGYTIKTVHLPIAGFVADHTGGCSPFTVNFDVSDTLYADDISMSFGDGHGATTGFSNEYTAAGLYDVSLTASGRLALAEDALTRFDYIEVLSPPIADFHAGETAGDSPATISFFDDSTGGDRWTWAFGDGETSGAQNPSHEYTTGTYSVILTAGNKYCSDSKTRTDYIVITEPQAQWTSHWGETEWELRSTPDAEWVSSDDLHLSFYNCALDVIGSWTQNYRPNKIRITVSASSSSDLAWGYDTSTDGSEWSDWIPFGGLGTIEFDLTLSNDLQSIWFAFENWSYYPDGNVRITNIEFWVG